MEGGLAVCGILHRIFAKLNLELNWFFLTFWYLLCQSLSSGDVMPMTVDEALLMTLSAVV